MEQNINQFEESGKNDVLLNSFLINKKKHRVLLHYDKLVWEKENSKGNKTTLPIQDIISVRVSRRRKLSNTHRSFTNLHNPSAPTSDNNIDESSSKETQFINVHYAKRLENSRSEYNRFRKSTITMYNSDHRTIKLWSDKLTTILDKECRPKRMLMFVNPYGGRKQALTVYEKHAKPLLQLANIDVSCVISQRANQIRDMIMTQPLDQYDAVCCVGGDGTFAEVFNGLIFRTIKDMGMDPLRPEFIPKPKLPIGVIPAGSTDTVSYCLHGTTDVRTAVIHVILGQTRGLDLSSVCNSNGLVRLYASVMSYGYLGDVAYESEKFRWMGPKRYDYSGFKKIIANNGYEGEIVFLRSPETKDDPANSDNDMKCLVDCSRCLKYKETTTQRSDLDSNNIDYILMTTAYQAEEVKPNSNWKNVKGKFFMISGANVSCSCSRSPNGFSPFCHLGDGYIDIILVRHTTFFNNIRLLLTLINRNSNIRNLPFVELHRTKKFYFKAHKPPADSNAINGSCQPISVPEPKTSQWNCDGEVIHDSDVLISSHCQLIDVFMRGPHPISDIHNTTTCGGLCK